MATLEGMMPKYYSEPLDTRPEKNKYHKDSMVVQELSMKTCDEFAQHFVHRVEHLASSCHNMHLVLDRYDDEQLPSRRQE